MKHESIVRRTSKCITVMLQSFSELRGTPDTIPFKTSTAPFMGHMLTPEGQLLWTCVNLETRQPTAGSC